MKRISIIISLSVFYISCNNSKTTHGDSLRVAKLEKIETPAGDTLNIDLVDLKAKGLLINTQVVTVNDDPVYHKTKKFNALPLKELLEKFSSIENLNAANTKVVFECEDGYKPEMPLEKLLSAKAFLAVSDVDAPEGREWEQILKDGHAMKAEPFYLIYAGVSPKDGDFKWPYNLVKIHFAPLNENDAMLVPKDATAMTGYNLFKKHCQTCHAINKIGGKMGPELNFPKSVIEYWKIEDLKAFIQNPASYRNDVKMPTLGIKPTEVTEILKYLEYMSKHKI